MRAFIRKHFDLLVILSISMIFSASFCYVVVVLEEESTPTIINSPELERQAALNLKLDQVLGVLIDELYEEKEARAVCEETVDRWAHDARTRQEVKNEAKRLKERGKKKGAKK